MKYKLRDYQEQAVDKGVALLQEPEPRNGVIVLPTGAGKSLVISNIADRMEGSTLVLQPSKEILEQNYIKLLALGRSDVSIFSASLGIKRINKITLATIGSIHKKPELFAEFSQILVDECDLVNAKQGMYKTFFETIGKPVLGFTATPWRMQPGFQIGEKRVKGGRIFPIYSGSINRILTRTKPRIFDEIIHITQIPELYRRGYLCPLHYEEGYFDNKQLTFNTTGADFTEATYKRISSDVIMDSVNAVKTTQAKHHLIFTKMIDDARTIADHLNDAGIICEVLTGETPSKIREAILNRFMSGETKALANVGVLTVGFDHPALDHIVLARPINSARLYYQMLGRGVRIHDSKDECIITDLCGSVDRLGKIETWKIKPDEKGNIRLFASGKPLTGIDLKTGEDLENKKQNSFQKTGSTIQFGKHKGKQIADVPDDYLIWIVDNFSPGAFRNQAIDEIARRAV